MKLDHGGGKVGMIPEQFIAGKTQCLGEAVKIDHRHLIAGHDPMGDPVVFRHIGGQPVEGFDGTVTGLVRGTMIEPSIRP